MIGDSHSRGRGIGVTGVVMTTLAAVLGVGGLLPDRAWAVDLAGTPQERPAPAADTIQAAAGSLEAAAVGFARAFGSGSADRMAAVLASGGIRLHLDGPGHAGLSSRQAVATLRDFLRNYDTSEAIVTRAAPVEGSPDRGFAEIRWGARIPGTSQTVYQSLFLGLNRQSGDWRVDEVRLLR